MAKADGLTGILLINLGTPDSPQTADVRKYLREFLMDWRVIDIAPIPRWMLVNLIIAPTRAPKVAKEYVKLWDDKRGMPLLYHGISVKEKLQARLGGKYVVALGMRYQNPSIEQALNELKAAKVGKIKVLPLFPQYASATTGSAVDKVMEIVRNWQVIPDLEFIQSFHTNPSFIQCFVDLGRKYWEHEEYDHVIFSYHGLPERHLKKMGADYNKCSYPDCKGMCAKGMPENHYCYRSACYETSALIAKELGIPESQYTVCFQSRLGKDPWIQPYTEDVVEELAKQGVKRVLAYSPAFVADCLETTLEVGEEYKEQFEEMGGEHWQLVESLNDMPEWIDTLMDILDVQGEKVAL